MTTRDRIERGLKRRAALGPSLGSFDLSEWAIRTGAGQIGDDPSGDAYLTRRADDSLSHLPADIANVGYYFNASGSNFSVNRPFITTPETEYDVTTVCSFLASNDRVTFRFYQSNGTTVIAETGSTDVPLTNPQTLIHTITTPAGAAGGTTYVRINQNSTGNPTGFFFTEPVFAPT